MIRRLRFLGNFARLSVREAPTASFELRRASSFRSRAATADDKDRSIEGVFSTEAPVEIWDWYRGEIVDEILLNSGAEIPDQIPVLANHDRWSLDSVIGSARSIRAEQGEAGGPAVLAGRMYFVDGDEDAERIWNKVKQGHLRDLSVGYLIHDCVEIAPGTTATVAGRKYTAGDNTLRVATRWSLKEVSVTPIGADAGAKTRSQGAVRMNPKLRKYLESIGLRADASEADAIAYYQALTGEQRTKADSLATRSARPATGGTGSRQPGAAGARGDVTVVEGEEEEDPPSEDDTEEEDPPADDTERTLAVERQRIRQIHSAAGDDVPRPLVRRAIEEGWSMARTNREFLQAIRSGRNPGERGGVPSGAPAGHSRSREADTNVRTLAAAMAIGNGLNPTAVRMHDGRRSPTRADQLTERDADLGHELSRLSAIDLVRECVRIDTGRYLRDPEEAIRSAVSGATFAYVFSTNIYAKLTAGWDRVGDTTLGWCDEEDVANFLQQEDISLTANARLDQLPRGTEAKHATAADSHETYKIARYAKQFVVDEQDILDDRLGAIMRMPEEMGEAAKRLRPDLVYSLLLESPALVADAKAVFHADHGNLLAGALGDASLKAAISAMGKQRLNKDVLNITPTHLIVPAALDWTAQGLTSAAALAKLFGDGNDPVYTTENLIARKRLTTVMDDRIGATGVIDPRTKAVRAGSDTNWFLTARSPRGIRVVYRRGTNRLPAMRNFVLDKGKWGMGWDINYDIGAAFMDYRFVAKSTGAGG